MRRRGAALALGGVLALIAAGGASAVAPPRVILTLVDPTTSLSPEPPLAGAFGEQEAHIFKQRVNSREHVAVGVDSTGRPVSVVVVQRLRVIGTGDYLWTVPAPVASVTATADSESEPGQRQGAIRWAGFSSKERLLGARARLIVAKAAPSLPLRLQLETTVDGRPLAPGTTAGGQLSVTLTLRNTTRIKAPTASARAELGPLMPALDRARRGVYPSGGVAVTVETPVDPRTALVEAPLRVTGELRFPAGRIDRAVATGGRLAGNGLRFSVLLGDGRPLTHVVRLTGRAAGLAAPKIRVGVQTERPQRTLRPPLGASWAEALRLNPRLDSRQVLTVAEDAFLRTARASQYDTYLANPGPSGAGTNRADYLYVTAPPRAVAAPPPGGGLGTAGLLLVVAGGLAVAGGLVVGWAHL